MAINSATQIMQYDIMCNVHFTNGVVHSKYMAIGSNVMMAI